MTNVNNEEINKDIVKINGLMATKEVTNTDDNYINMDIKVENVKENVDNILVTDGSKDV